MFVIICIVIIVLYFLFSGNSKGRNIQTQKKSNTNERKIADVDFVVSSINNKLVKEIAKRAYHEETRINLSKWIRPDGSIDRDGAVKVLQKYYVLLSGANDLYYDYDKAIEIAYQLNDLEEILFMLSTITWCDIYGNSLPEHAQRVKMVAFSGNKSDIVDKMFDCVNPEGKVDLEKAGNIIGGFKN